MSSIQASLFPEAAAAVRLSQRAAAKRRDRAIARAQDHADQDQGNWKMLAITGMRHFLNVQKGEPFLAEKFVEWTKQRLYPQPPDGRAWGAILRSAVKLELIEQIGWGRAATSNLSPKPLWRRKS